MPSLLWLFLAPLISSLVAFLFPGNGKTLKRLAIIMSLIPLALLIFGNTRWLGSQISYPWLPQIGIDFHLSIDSLSLLFLFLTAVVVPTSLFAVRSNTLTSPHMFYGLVLLLQALLIGFFTARDLALFTFFWEAMILPLYFIINLWGSHRRQNASLKFLIYMVGGSLLMVAAVLALYFAAATQGEGTFNMDVLTKIASSVPYAAWLGAIFLLAFAVKTPLFPFHGWLPDAYCQAPAAGTILLSAILSKAGIYGILRIGLGFFPEFVKAWSPLLLGLAIVGVFYGGLAAWRQMDFKRLLAYTSFSHVNFILAGLFIWNQVAHSGAILQALNHGINIAALFLVAWWLEERLGTTAMEHVGGLAKFLPHLCWLTLFFSLTAIALPGTNNFIGEFMILFGLFGKHPWLTAILGLTIILSVIYMLRLMQKIYFQTPKGFQKLGADIYAKEIFQALPLVALILWIGIYPSPVLKQIETAAQNVTHTSIEEPS